MVDPTDADAKFFCNSDLSPALIAKVCGSFLVEMLGRLPDPAAACPRRSHPRLRPLANDRQFIIGEHAEQTRDHATGACGQINVFAKANEGDILLPRHYREQATLPSARKKASVPRTYRTRPDPFATVWPEVEEQLRAEPRLRAKTLFDWLRQTHPGQFLDSHRRTFERRVRQWRATHGPGQAIIFRQVHQPGDLAASDFTSMNALGITITGRPFDHLVYHFVLTYSNW